MIPKIIQYISPETLNIHTQATHFVIEIDWGANAAITLKCSNDKNYEKTEVQGSLKVSTCEILQIPFKLCFFLYNLI